MSSYEKLSIYPSPSPPITLIESPSQLTPHIAAIREQATDIFGDGKKVMESLVDGWVKVERKVTNEVRSILPKNEPLTPGILYIGVAGLAGSVMARNRNILIRLLLPPTLLVASAPYFLPQTSHNIRSYLSQIEDTHFPAYAAQHNQLNRTISEYYHSTRQSVEGLEGQASELGSKVVKGVEDSTGLSLKQAFSTAERMRVGGKQKERELVERAKGGEVVGVVMEERPVAVLVAPKTGEAGVEKGLNASGSGKRLV